jgi:hypothetical protein
MKTIPVALTAACLLVACSMGTVSAAYFGAASYKTFGGGAEPGITVKRSSSATR